MSTEQQRVENATRANGKIRPANTAERSASAAVPTTVELDTLKMQLAGALATEVPPYEGGKPLAAVSCGPCDGVSGDQAIGFSCLRTSSNYW